MILWLPPGTEPEDAASWREVIARAVGPRPSRVELERRGDEWRVRIAVLLGGWTPDRQVAAPVWSDLTDDVTAALRSAGKPVMP